MHPLAQQLLAHIRRYELLAAGDRVGVAVSGGIDSLALLRLLLELRFELGIVVSVVHFNHQLRGAESDADEEFVGNLARQHDLGFHIDRADVGAHAREENLSIETAARELRYEFFRSLIAKNPRGPKPHVPEEATLRGPEGPLSHGAAEAMALPEAGRGPAESRAPSNSFRLDKIATGHTLDDQAETVLMRMIRGAGMRGLGAIYPRIEVEDDDGEYCGEIVRPLLGTRRCELEGYLKDMDQQWREDSTNADPHFTRNRVRRLLVPLIEKEFNPKIAEGLAELAEIAREEEEYWENEIAGWMGTTVHWTEGEPESKNPRAKNAGRGEPLDLIHIQPAGSTEDSPYKPRMNASVDRLWFLGEPLAVQRRLVKAIGEQAGIPLEFVHVEEIVRFAAASGPGGKDLALPLRWKLRRESAELVFVAPDICQERAPAGYEYSLAVPGKVMVNEAGSEFEAQIVERAGKSLGELDTLLQAELPYRPLTIRNWRAGDRFWPAHTKAPRKIKELLADLHIAGAARASWPVVVSGDEIVWVRGLPVSAEHRAKAGQSALWIREIALREGESC